MAEPRHGPKEVQRILAEVHDVSERQRRWPRRVLIVSVEAVAEPLAPAAARRLHGVDHAGRDSDAWFAYTGETAAPHPVTSRADTLLEEPLYEEDLRPVCSPTLLVARGYDGAGRKWYVPNDRLRHMLIGKARVSKVDGSQSLDLQSGVSFLWTPVQLLTASTLHRRTRSTPCQAHEYS